MRILVTGSRDWSDYKAIKSKLIAHGATLVIEGGQRGADALARLAAKNLKIRCETVNADWEAFGKKAGGERNQRMLDVWKPNLVLAFPMEGSKGTWDMVRRAKKANVKVEICGPFKEKPAKYRNLWPKASTPALTPSQSPPQIL